MHAHRAYNQILIAILKCPESGKDHQIFEAQSKQEWKEFAGHRDRMEGFKKPLYLIASEH